jgi:hypothetical protein
MAKLIPENPDIYPEKPGFLALKSSGFSDFMGTSIRATFVLTFDNTAWQSIIINQ